MSAYATATMTASTEMTAIQPIVKIGGHIVDWCTCLQIEQSAGIVPSKALLRIGGNAYDISGNITLNAYSWFFKKWSRVEITVGSQTVFMGTLQKRRDKGQANSIIWEAWDDRWLLSLIPVRGCLVYDKQDAAVKFISRYVCRTNPDGGRNCVPAVISGIGLVPVFAAYADESSAYVETTNDADMTAGVVGSWTPQKFIQYLCAVANLQKGVVDGTTLNWAYLKSSAGSFQWLYSSCQFDGTDTDRVMSKKMPDLTFAGQTILAALNKTLDVGGIYGLSTGINNSSSGTKSQISFYLRRAEYPDNPQNLHLQRGGSASDIISIVDFELEEDASEVRGRVLVEGAPRRVETSVTTDSGATVNSEVLERVWSTDEKTAFANIINGNGTYARYPATVPNINNGETWVSAVAAGVLADGGSGRPLAEANTKEALQLARQLLPNPHRAFRINSTTALSEGVFNGVANEYTSTANYPVLKIPRPVLMEQLQHYMADTTHKLRERFPIRVEVTDDNGKWHDVTANDGLKVTEDGRILLTGLTDDLANNDNVYDGSLISAPSSVTNREVRINLVVPMDHRIIALASSNSNGQVDTSVAEALDGPPLLYVDAPEGFRENHQYKSSPAVPSAFPDGSAGTKSAPITGMLEDDRTAIAQHAARRLDQVQYVRRLSSWIMPGIRPEFYVGQYIGNIVVTGQTGDVDYEIQAPIETLTFDFMGQQTVVGGLLAATATTGQARQAVPMDSGRLVRTKAEPPKPATEPKPMRQLAMAKKPFEKFTEE